MTRDQAKKMAQSRDCSCVNGKDRDNNYNQCIDKIFDWHESELQRLGLTTEVIEIKRNKKGSISNITGISHIEKLLQEYKKKELPDADEPFHFEAEIASGFKYFIQWLKRKEK